MLKAFKYRLYPTRKQIQAIDEMLETHRRIYNNALRERKTAWEERQESVSYANQSASYKRERETNEYYQKTNFSSVQRTLRRLDKAFKSFFRRVKAGDKPGYPRFKANNRWKSVEFTYNDGSKIGTNGKLYIQHIGEVKIKLHRPIKGGIKTITIMRQADRYYACFSCETAPEPLELTGAVVGLDMGISNLVTTSDGEFFDSPEYLRQSERDIKRLHRELHRRNKGSNRRKETIRKLQRAYEHIANQRKDYAHKVALSLVQDYDLIAIENLNVKGMVKNRHMAKSIADASWSTFGNMLSSKAAEAGKTVVRVAPNNTSQICSVCGEKVPKSLSVRVHNCPYCGLSLDRDLNAAINILHRALPPARTGPSGMGAEVVPPA